MTKEALETLIGRLEVWALIFGVLVAIGVAGESVYGVRIWWNNRKLHDAEDAANKALQVQVSEANDRAKQAESHLADAKAASALAEQHAADANERAEIARKDAESFRLQIADAAKRAAQAEEKAAQAMLDLAKYRAGRKLTPEQQQRIAVKLKVFSGTPYELAVDPGPEAVNLLSTIDTILRESGWDTKESAKTSFRFILTLPSGSKVG